MQNYNPMLDYQRNNLLAQQQLIQSQLNQLNNQRATTFTPYPQQNQNSNQFFIKQVGSIDEAKSFPVDPSVIYLFPDTGTGKIYLKRLNTDNGKSELFTYSPEQESASPATPAGVDPFAEIKNRLATIETKIGGIYESISIFDKPAGSNATADARKNAKSKPAEVSADSADA